MGAVPTRTKDQEMEQRKQIAATEANSDGSNWARRKQILSTRSYRHNEGLLLGDSGGAERVSARGGSDVRAGLRSGSREPWSGLATDRMVGRRKDTGSLSANARTVMKFMWAYGVDAFRLRREKGIFLPPRYGWI